MEGYIKLYRKLLESPIFQNEKALKIWIWCLCKATHKEIDVLVGQQIVHLESGQFVFGRKKASKELKINESTVYKYMQLLQDMLMVHIESNTKFTVVTIEKWQEYQIEELKNNMLQKQRGNNKRTQTRM